MNREVRPIWSAVISSMARHNTGGPVATTEPLSSGLYVQWCNSEDDYAEMLDAAINFAEAARAHGPAFRRTILAIHAARNTHPAADHSRGPRRMRLTFRLRTRADYDRKVAQGKRHNQALIALGRRRCDVLLAMLRDGTLYQADNHPTA